MKRHAVAIILHPVKNRLMPELQLRQILRVFCENLIGLLEHYQMLRFNLVFPAHLLTLIDPILMARLREIQKSERIEWLTTGYTEPFLSFSPEWLTGENLKAGLDTFWDLTGMRPAGFMPAFSNWEPAIIDTLREPGMQYAVVSRALLGRREKNACGFWITEHAGSTIPVFAVHSFDAASAPDNLPDWLDRTLRMDPFKTNAMRLVAIDFRIPLINAADSFEWLKSLAGTLDALLVKYQIMRIGEYPSLAFPIGLHFLNPSLIFKRSDREKSSNFLNYLHTYDQISLLHRKFLDVADALHAASNLKKVAPLLRQLFFVQDINRYLPASDSGFAVPTDRQWSYSQLIDIENKLAASEQVHGSQLRIADFLRNGTKSIILSNRALKVYLDHKSGGQIFELDVRDRLHNCCAGYNPQTYAIPRVLDAVISHTAFGDHFFDPGSTIDTFRQNGALQNGDFLTGQFHYSVKKIGKGVKAILSRQGSITRDQKTFPLVMEKVFGLDESNPALSFAYQLSNPSLASFGCTFGIAITLLLPGTLCDQAHVTVNKKNHRLVGDEPLVIESATQWSIVDTVAGLCIQFRLNKMLSLWCTPLNHASPSQSGLLTMVLAAPVELAENGQWSLAGKMTFKPVRVKVEEPNAI